MPDGDGGLRRDTDKKVAVVFGQLSPRVEIELQGSHELARPLHRHHQHVLRVASRLEPGRRFLGEADDHGTHCGQGGTKRLFGERADAAAWPVCEAVLRLPAHLRLAGCDQVHRTCNGAHDSSGVPDGDVEDLLETQ